MEDQIGGKSWPQTFNAAGQKFVETHSSIGFILESGVFRKAGKFCWPQKFEDSQLSLPGISLNTTLYSLIDAKDEKQFFVYDQSKDRYFQLVDRKEMKENIGHWEQDEKQLRVTPLDCYRTVDKDQVPESIREYIGEKTESTGSSRLY